MIVPTQGSASSHRLLIDEYGIAYGFGDGELTRETGQITWESLSPEKRERVQRVVERIEAAGAELKFLLGI